MKNIEARDLVNNKACLEDIRFPSKLVIKKDKAKNLIDIRHSCKIDIKKGKSVYVGVGGNREIRDKGDPLDDVGWKC